MSKKSFDYKATLHFEVSSHNQPEYQTDEMIKKSILQLLEQYLNETKTSKYLKIERNYTRAKMVADREADLKKHYKWKDML